MSITTEHDAPALQLDGLVAGYNGIPVVRDVDLTVAPGEVVALLGANGAGKTTTLSAIAGLIKPISGDIRMAGDDIGGGTPYKLARAGMSLVPENRALFYSLTTTENLRLGRRKGSTTDEEVLDLLPELRKCLDRKAGYLSGGEQQMLAVGRALMARPRLLLVDEMSLGLAPVVVERLLPVLRTVAKSFGTAVLLVEQHVSLALEVAERAYVLARGRIVLTGAASQLRDRRELLQACYIGDLEAAAELSGEDGPQILGLPNLGGSPPDLAPGDLGAT